MATGIYKYISSMPSATKGERAKKVGVITLLVVAVLTVAAIFITVVGLTGSSDTPEHYFTDIGKHLKDNILGYGLGGGFISLGALFYIFYPQKPKSVTSSSARTDGRPKVRAAAPGSSPTPSIAPPEILVKALGGREVYEKLPEIAIVNENIDDLWFKSARRTDSIMKGSFVCRGHRVPFIVISYHRKSDNQELHNVFYPREFVRGEAEPSSCWNVTGSLELLNTCSTDYHLTYKGCLAIQALLQDQHLTCQLEQVADELP